MPSKQDASVRKNHRWDIITDVCVRCNLQRRGISMSKNLQFYSVGSFIGYEYYVDGKWTEMNKSPNCIGS